MMASEVGLQVARACRKPGQAIASCAACASGTVVGQAESAQPSDAFVVYKEEHLVFLDGTAERAAELILAKRIYRRSGCVEGNREHRRTLLRRKSYTLPWKRVAARLGGCVHDAAAAAEARAIRIGQNLKLADGFDTERSSDDAVASAVIPKSLDVCSVQEKFLAFGPRASDGVAWLSAIERSFGLPL